MERRNKIEINIPKRQSPIALIFISLKALRSILGNLWPFILVFFFSRETSNTDLYFLFVGLITMVLSVSMSIIQFYRYHYTLTEKELIIEKGVFRRSYITVPYERVQLINKKRNIIHRYTNTVGISIETAGSSDTEFDIPALSIPEAEAIEDFILDQKQELDPEISTETSTSQVADRTEVPLMKLSFAQVLKYGLTHNHFQSLGAILALASVIFSQVIQFIEFDLVDIIEDTFTGKFILSLSYILAGIVIFLLIGTVVSVILTTLRYYNLRVSKAQDHLIVKSGLIQENEKKIRKPKIQIFSWSTNPLRKLINLNKLSFIQAGSSDNTGNQTVTIAGADDSDREHILEYARAGKSNENYYSFRPAMYTLGRTIVRFILLPIAIIGFIIYLFFDLYLLYFLVLGIIPIILTYIWYRNASYEINKHFVVISTQLYSKEVKYMGLIKVQGVKISRTPYEQRKGLCKLHLFSAGGSFSMIYIDYQLGRQIQDFILYKVESSTEEWM